MDEEDTVEREYPVYASTVDKIFSKHEPQRLTLLEFPQRPPWRPYETGQAESVQYKPGHSMMQMKVPQQVRYPCSMIYIRCMFVDIG